MAGKTNIQKESYWRGVMSRQAESGLSVRRFCAEAKVSEPSFYAWRRKLRVRVRGHSYSQKPKRRSEGSNNGGGFVSLRLLDSTTGLEVIHPLGYRILVSGEVNVTTLRRVVDVLDGRSDG
jgi:hypothetical protein